MAVQQQQQPSTTTTVWLGLLLVFAASVCSACQTCSKDFNSLSCSNPPYEQRYTLQITNYKGAVESALTYICHYSAQQLYLTFHKGCNFSTVQYVLFQRCPLPNVSFSEVFSQLGILPEKVLELNFENARTRRDLKIESRHLSGLSNLTILRFMNNLFTTIPEDLLKHTPNLEHFLFMRNNVPSPPESLFANTPKLISINLMYNNFTSIPDNIFTNLPSLAVLRVYGNTLHELNPKILSNVPEVYKLELSANGLTNLTSDTFRKLPKLQHLYLMFNNLESLPEDIFHNNPKLNTVHLSNNRLVSFPSGLFAKSKNITDFDFQNNQVTTIPQQLFQGLQNLTNLTMPSNSLEGIPEGAFTDLVKLEKLLIQNNPLKTVPAGTFDKQQKVKIINLTNTSLTDLPDNLFKNCEGLQELDLAQNHLTKLKSTVFPHPTTVLHYLQLSSNNLSFSSMTSEPRALEQSKIFVEQFPLSDQVNLTDLFLNNNKIQVIPHALRNLEKLKQLNLKNNSIEHLDYHDFLSRFEDANDDANGSSMANIITLPKQILEVELSDNPLICDCNIYKFSLLLQDRISEEEKDNIRLHVDDKSKVKCSLPDDRNVHHLVMTLNLNTLVCYRKQCHPSCICKTRPHDHMFIMECASQNLQAIPKIKPHLPEGNHSITLDLSNNSISSLEDLHSPEYSNVVNLTMPHNYLKVINESYLPRRLEALNVRGNAISHLSQSVINYLNVTNPTLIVDGNPWLCDCHLVELHTFLRDPLRKLADSHSIMCNNLKKPLLSLAEEELCPTIQQPMVVVTIAATTVFLFLFFVLGTVSIYKYQQNIKVWLFNHQMFLWLIAKEEAEPNKKYDAFISYANKDEEYVNTVLVPGLENNDPKYRVCLQYRDWLPGDYIQNQINQSIEDSHRTIILLTSNFIENVWGQIEFKTAHCKALKEKNKNIIVIVLGKVPPDSELDDELKLYISTRTYLQSDHPRFWQNLRYAMPHPQEFLHRKPPKTKKNENLQMVQTNGKVTV